MLWLALGLGGCGYGMDAPGLPRGHRSLALEPIRNETYTAEVDVRLYREIRRRLLRDPAIRLTEPAETDLILRVAVTNLGISRRRSVEDTSVAKLVYSLSGNMTLLEKSSGRLLMDRRPVRGNSRLDFAERVVETPAVRDEGLNDAIAVLADEIVEALLLDF